MKTIIRLLFFIILFGCQEQSPLKTALALKPLPSFDLQLPDSTTWINTANFPKDKAVVMFLFTPICPYCRSQMSEIVKNISNLKEIQFYLVTNFPVVDIKQIYNHYKLYLYPNIIIGRDTANSGLKYFETPGVPFTAVYGKDNKPKKFFLGKTAIWKIQEAAKD